MRICVKDATPLEGGGVEWRCSRWECEAAGCRGEMCEAHDCMNILVSMSELSKGIFGYHVTTGQSNRWVVI